MELVLIGGVAVLGIVYATGQILGPGLLNMAQHGKNDLTNEWTRDALNQTDTDPCKWLECQLAAATDSAVKMKIKKAMKGLKCTPSRQTKDDPKKPGEK